MLIIMVNIHLFFLLLYAYVYHSLIVVASLVVISFVSLRLHCRVCTAMLLQETIVLKRCFDLVLLQLAVKCKGTVGVALNCCLH